MAIIKFIKKRGKKEENIKKVIRYILDADKGNEELFGGLNCNSESAFEKMMATKESFGKLGGRQYIHFVQSFADDENVSQELAAQIAEKLLQFPDFKGFEIVYATHINEDHTHTHFVLNTVNCETGYKWQQSEKRLETLKEFSNSICREYGLGVIVLGQGKKAISDGEFRSDKKKLSWKTELFHAVRLAKNTAISKEDFCEKLSQLNIGCEWNGDNKYITFTTREGKKCRNKKLYPPEQFTKEALLKKFAENAQKKEEKRQNAKFNLILECALHLFSIFAADNEQHKNYPLTALYHMSEADREKLIFEMKKNTGLDWEEDMERG